MLIHNREYSRCGAVILAGGFGTRIRHLYPDVPKPMIVVYGRPFVEWVIRYLATQGIRDFSISTGYKAEIIEAYLAKRQDDGLSIASAREDEPLGTAGGFLMAVPALSRKDIIVAVNGDSLILADLGPAMKLMGKDNTDAVIIGCRVSDCSRYGSLAVDNEGFLLNFAEKRMGKGIINSGIYVFRSEIIRLFPEQKPLSFEFDVFPEFLTRGFKIRVIVTDAPFIDIGTPESIAEAEMFIKTHSAKFRMEELHDYRQNTS